jgi:hypothetical protein
LEVGRWNAEVGKKKSKFLFSEFRIFLYALPFLPVTRNPNKAQSGVHRMRKAKNPGPVGQALGCPAGVIWVITFTRRIQVSGFGCQVSATESDPLCRSRS